MQRLATPGDGEGETRRNAYRAAVEAAKAQIQPLILEHMDVAAAAEMPRSAFEAQLAGWVQELLAETKIQLNFIEQRELVEALVADMLGLGPLEPLLADESVSDIMVNGPKQVYVERRGKLELTDVAFRDDQHLMNICSKIVTRVGRRIDESRPLVDARLPDGSRVNIIIPPLAIDGASISIRKFSKKSITLDTMAANASISPAMATVLKIAARCRLNILVSGGTGSGKTTLFNALSRMIDRAERVVTIEDAAELQLQQPHVVRLETRTANLEGTGEITMRGLLKNALRMRPDRIIIGECRGEEALDMLQAMNTGHDGSMSTIHANNPREALTRLENMIGMTGINLPSKAMRTQIASAVHLICQVNRMRDGQRRVTQITEVVGMEGEVITTQDLFAYPLPGRKRRRPAARYVSAERHPAGFSAAGPVLRARPRPDRGDLIDVRADRRSDRQDRAARWRDERSDTASARGGLQPAAPRGNSSGACSRSRRGRHPRNSAWRPPAARPRSARCPRRRPSRGIDRVLHLLPRRATLVSGWRNPAAVSRSRNTFSGQSPSGSGRACHWSSSPASASFRACCRARRSGCSFRITSSAAWAANASRALSRCFRKRST